MAIEADAVDELRLGVRVRPDAHLEERQDVRPGVAEVAQRAGQHVLVDQGDGAEGAAGDKEVLLIEVFAGHLGDALGSEQDGVGQPQPDQAEGGGTVVEGAERGAAEVDEFDLDPTDADPFDEGGEEGVDAGPGVEGGVDEVDPDDAEGVLLTARILVPQPQVQEHLAGRAERRLLEAQADPGVALPLAVVRGGGDRVGEGEEAGLGPALGGEPIDQQLVLVLQHLLQPFARDVALGVPVDGVADPHVVGRHALGDGPRGPARLEEMPDDLLPRPDLGEGAVGGTVQVDGQSLALGGGAHVRGLLVHADRLAEPPSGNQRKPASKKRLLNGDVSPSGHLAKSTSRPPLP